MTWKNKKAVKGVKIPEEGTWLSKPKNIVIGKNIDIDKNKEQILLPA